MPGRVMPVIQVSNDSMVNRIKVDVSHQFNKILLCIDCLSAKVGNEETALTVVFPVIGLGITIKQMRKL